MCHSVGHTGDSAVPHSSQKLHDPWKPLEMYSLHCGQKPAAVESQSDTLPRVSCLDQRCCLLPSACSHLPQGTEGIVKVWLNKSLLLMLGLLIFIDKKGLERGGKLFTLSVFCWFFLLLCFFLLLVGSYQRVLTSSLAVNKVEEKHRPFIFLSVGQILHSVQEVGFVTFWQPCFTSLLPLSSKLSLTVTCARALPGLGLEDFTAQIYNNCTKINSISLDFHQGCDVDSGPSTHPV